LRPAVSGVRCSRRPKRSSTASRLASVLRRIASAIFHCELQGDKTQPESTAAGRERPAALFVRRCPRGMAPWLRPNNLAHLPGGRGGVRTWERLPARQVTCSLVRPHLELRYHCRDDRRSTLRHSSDSNKTSHQRYVVIFKLLERRDKELADALGRRARRAVLGPP
jgi:hypothetical protein